MHEMLSHIQGIYENQVKGPKLSNQIDTLLEGVRSKQYQPLMTRTRCGEYKCFGSIKFSSLKRTFGFFLPLAESLENRIAHFAKKRRIEISKNDESDEE